MKSTGWLGALLALWLSASPAPALGPIHRWELARVNRCLAGTVVDYTHNHGSDNRIWSPALCQRRDVYVYLPPCYDPSHQYPGMLYLHGFLQDEKSFLEDVCGPLDAAIVAGKLPPMIVVAPDGSLSGRASLLSAGSFFINSDAGNYEDYTIGDVWGFLVRNYPIRPEREAHVLAGISMGGFAAFNLGIKHQQTFKVIVGIFPPLNLRWMDCHGRYMAKFDPDCWGWRTQLDRGFEVIGRFYGGAVTIRLKKVIDPLFGRGSEALEAIIRENPIEMIDAYGLKDGDLSMYVAYAGRDGFNIDAQVESFLYRANERGIAVDVGYDRRGRHDMKTARKLLPGILDWLTIRLAPVAQAGSLCYRKPVPASP